MKYIHAAATELADYLTGYTVIATKSTVPVGTGDDIESLISKKTQMQILMFFLYLNF
ncbi:hypothetical protein B10204_14030 [Campylobacter jejuni]|nr:hypothetical protein B10204_14030 [Campylobacter jejuni]